MTAGGGDRRTDGVGRWLPWLLLATVGLRLLPALDGELIWDDLRQIRDCEHIRTTANIPGYFHQHVWELDDGDDAPSGMRLYRPVFQTALNLQYAAWGEASARGFHLGSLLLHLLCTGLVFALARRWTGSSPGAVAAALLFGWHPVLTEAHAFVSAQTDLIAAAGVLGATLLLDLARDPDRRPGQLWGLAIASGVVLLAGLLAKEVALLALPGIAAWLVVWRGVAPRRLGPLGVAAAAFIAMRWAALADLPPARGGAPDWAGAVRHAPILVADGLRALLAMQPVGYRDLSYEYVPLGWGGAAAAAAVVVVVAAAAWWGRRRLTIAPLALLTLAAMLAPVALVTTVHGWGGFGRYLYLPAAVGAIAAVEAARASWEVSRTRGANPTVRAVGVIALLAYLALQQIGLGAGLRAYADQEQLARAAIVAAPGVGTGHELLGAVLLERGELDGAIDAYRSALAREPDRHEASTNLALALIHADRPAEGLEVILAREQLRPPGPRSSYVVALAHLRLGELDAAAARLLWALQRAPDDVDLRWLQGELLARHPDPAAYRAWLDEALRRPEHDVAAQVVRPLLDASR